MSRTRCFFSSVVELLWSDVMYLKANRPFCTLKGFLLQNSERGRSWPLSQDFLGQNLFHLDLNLSEPETSHELPWSGVCVPAVTYSRAGSLMSRSVSDYRSTSLSQDDHHVPSFLKKICIWTVKLQMENFEPILTKKSWRYDLDNQCPWTVVTYGI